MDQPYYRRSGNETYRGGSSQATTGSLVTLVTQSHLGSNLDTRSKVHASMNKTQQQQPQTCPDGSYHVMMM
jgi:hypothetical protein